MNGVEGRKRLRKDHAHSEKPDARGPKGVRRGDGRRWTSASKGKDTCRLIRRKKECETSKVCVEKKTERRWNRREEEGGQEVWFVETTTQPGRRRESEARGRKRRKDAIIRRGDAQKRLTTRRMRCRGGEQMGCMRWVCVGGRAEDEGGRKKDGILVREMSEEREKIKSREKKDDDTWCVHCAVAVGERAPRACGARRALSGCMCRKVQTNAPANAQRKTAAPRRMTS